MNAGFKLYTFLNSIVSLLIINEDTQILRNHNFENIFLMNFISKFSNFELNDNLVQNTDDNFL